MFDDALNLKLKYTLKQIFYLTRIYIIAYIYIRIKRSTHTMAFYLRYTATPDADMERGTSLHMTPFVVGQPATWNDEDERSEEEIVAESIDCDVDSITVVNGQYAQVLDGICAFDLYADSLEEAIEAAQEHNAGGDYSFATMGDIAVIFEGECVGDCIEGDLINATEILHKF